VYPIICNFAGITIYSYGLLVAIGLFSAFLYISQTLKKTKYALISQENFHTLFFFTVIFGAIGARLLYVITDFTYYFSYPLEVFQIWKGGIVYYGGFALGFLFIAAYVCIKKISFLKICDLFAPALALGHFFGRLGCFFAGCCYGKETKVPWSVVFTNANALAVKGSHIHPTQLYESFANFLLFLFLWLYPKKKKCHDGFVLVVYLFSYAAIRFTVETFRGDFRGIKIASFSISQAASVVLFIAAIFVMRKVRVLCKKN
jgi:phosphatidylglycerol:prolipoprotein diacylglycerol transferase